ncbi:MAG TPA: farnesyl-diphosphate farnesyltransferase [Verrucomicrobiales bacterium]|nr:farnesyl-diphosphate farnesyltransferase [Verrucomicrobiales bacterium]
MADGRSSTVPLKYHLKGQAQDGTLPGAPEPKRSLVKSLLKRKSADVRKLNRLLKRVSRSFYLTLRILPAEIRPQIGLAYLLARATDTIADTEIIPWEERLITLRMLRDRILGTHGIPLEFGELAEQQAKPSERELLVRIEEIIGGLALISPRDQDRVREVITTITSGQEMDLERFGPATPESVIALNTHSGLEDYTYRVAGCVGVFWTRMVQAHLFHLAPMYESMLLKNGVWFGQGLQLVNILRDLSEDLRRGRCYFPQDKLEEVGLTPGDLLNPENEERFRLIYDAYLDFAEARLSAGWEYTNALPRKFVRLRLSCAWPILIGRRTLEMLRTTPVLNPDYRVRVPRSEVYNIILASIMSHPFAGAWKRLYPTTQRES